MHDQMPLRSDDGFHVSGQRGGYPHSWGTILDLEYVGLWNLRDWRRPCGIRPRVAPQLVKGWSAESGHRALANQTDDRCRQCRVGDRNRDTCSGGNFPGPPEDERYVNQFAIERCSMVGQSVLSERLAMIRSDDEQSIRRQSAEIKLMHQIADGGVDHFYLLIVFCTARTAMLVHVDVVQK